LHEKIYHPFISGARSETANAIAAVSIKYLNRNAIT